MHSLSEPHFLSAIIYYCEHRVDTRIVMGLCGAALPFLSLLSIVSFIYSSLIPFFFFQFHQRAPLGTAPYVALVKNRHSHLFSSTPNFRLYAPLMIYSTYLLRGGRLY